MASFIVLANLLELNQCEVVQDTCKQYASWPIFVETELKESNEKDN